MSKRWQQWMPLKIDKIRGSMFFMALPDAAKVGYLFLLMAQWETEDGALPSDQGELATLSGLGDRWEEFGPRIMRKFDSIEGGKIRNEVNYQEWLEAKRVFEARSASAQRTNNTRSPHGHRTVTDTPTDTVTAPQGQIQEQEQKEEGLKPSVRPEEFANVWNRGRGHLPKVERFTESRRKKVQKRMAEGITLERFAEAVACCRGKPFLRGENDRGWMADFDWLIENDRNIEKAITKPYAGAQNGNGNRGPAGKGQRAIEAAREAILDLVGGEADGDSYGSAGDSGQGNAQVLLGELGDLRRSRPDTSTRPLLPSGTRER